MSRPVRIAAVVAVCVLSGPAQRVPLGAAVPLAVAALVAVGSLRLELAASFLDVHGKSSAALAWRLSRVCRRAALTLFAAALVYASSAF
jgi:hypothetical protein